MGRNNWRRPFLLGLMAGVYLWLYLYVAGAGREFLWTALPGLTGAGWWWSLPVCAVGGVLVGLASGSGKLPDMPGEVLGLLADESRVTRRDLLLTSAAALLPAIFGGSISPEAGLTASAALLWRLIGQERSGRSATDHNPAGERSSRINIKTRPHRVDNSRRKPPVLPVLLGAAVGFVGPFLAAGGGLGFERLPESAPGLREALLLPFLLCAGVLGARLFLGLRGTFVPVFETLRRARGHMACTVIGGVILGLYGAVFPLSLCSGDTALVILCSPPFDEGVSLLAMGAVKLLLTSVCMASGWKGGCIWPLNFAGAAFGCGAARLLGLDPVLCAAAVSGALTAAATGSPLFPAALLLCYPPSAVPVLLLGTAAGFAAGKGKGRGLRVDS